MKFKVGDLVIVNKYGLKWRITKPGSIGIVKSIIEYEEFVYVSIDFIMTTGENHRGPHVYNLPEDQLDITYQTPFRFNSGDI